MTYWYFVCLTKFKKKKTTVNTNELLDNYFHSKHQWRKQVSHSNLWGVSLNISFQCPLYLLILFAAVNEKIYHGWNLSSFVSFETQSAFINFTKWFFVLDLGHLRIKYAMNLLIWKIKAIFRNIKDRFYFLKLQEVEGILF